MTRRKCAFAYPTICIQSRLNLKLPSATNGHDDEDQIGRAGAMVILGFWLAFEQGGPEPKMISAWSCAGSKALFCVQR
jgi:hypothetical protein